MKSAVRDRGLIPYSLAALALGIAHGFSFTSPADHAWLGWVAQLTLLAGFLGLLRRGAAAHSPVRVGWLAWLFGLANFCAGLWWLYISMHHFGGMPAPIAAAAVVALSAYLAAFGALALAAAWRWAPPSGPTSHLLLTAAFWSLAEVLRGLVFTGFPWLAIGYAHADGPLAGFAPLVGVYGVGLAAFLAAALLARVWRGRPVSGAVLLALLMATGLALARIDWSRPAGNTPVSVRLLQGNVPQSLKFDALTSAQAIADYIEMISGAAASLVVTPETAFTRPLASLPPETREALLAALRASGATAVLGMPMRSTQMQSAQRPRAQITNSMVTVDPQGRQINRYDKRHLVPFGEFIPPGFAWFVDLMEIPLGEFGRGTLAQPLLEIDGLRLAFNICYEDLFGEELAHQVRDGANVLVNTSNLAWFGDTIALDQHLNITRLRAIELARPMLRATNTGATAHVDHRGRVVARLPGYRQAVLDTEVTPRSGLTPYARLGLIAPLTLVALVGALALASARPRPAGTGAAARSALREDRSR